MTSRTQPAAHPQRPPQSPPAWSPALRANRGGSFLHRPAERIHGPHSAPQTFQATTRKRGRQRQALCLTDSRRKPARPRSAWLRPRVAAADSAPARPSAVRRLFIGKEQRRQRRNQRARKHIRRDHGKNDRKTQRNENEGAVPVSRTAARRRCRWQAWRRTPETRPPPRFSKWRPEAASRFRDCGDVFDLDKRVVDKNADRQHQPAERHQIERLPHQSETPPPKPAGPREWT